MKWSGGATTKDLLGQPAKNIEQITFLFLSFFYERCVLKLEGPCGSGKVHEKDPAQSRGKDDQRFLEKGDQILRKSKKKTTFFGKPLNTLKKIGCSRRGVGGRLAAGEAGG